MEDQRSTSRQHRRYKVTMNGSCWFTTDVCADGFCAEMMRVLPPRTVVEGAIQVRGVQIPFAGGVAWAKRGDWHLNLRGRMGVHFSRIASEHARLLDPGRGDRALDAGGTKRLARYRAE